MKRFLNYFAIPNLTLFIVVISGLVSAYCLQSKSSLGLLSGQTLTSGEWWNLLFFPFRLIEAGEQGSGAWLWLGLRLYLFWIFGSSLENEIGDSRYTRYILSGIVLVAIGGLLFPGEVRAEFVYISVFLAIAYVAPNQEVLLFFILPVKMKWIAAIIVGLILLQSLATIVATGDVLQILGPTLGLGNYLLFFGREFILDRMQNRKVQQRRATMIPETRVSIHRCTICGITENDDAAMEFRFCNQCADHEYCMVHLRDHVHQN
ncbi:MAG: hypothetical protein JNM27_17825 [Leptospirales bacterium]|nr:hypothetical protein [Leptospirales bacterium]